MDEILKICGIALIALFSGLLLKSRAGSLSPYITQIASIVIFISAITALAPLIDFISSILGKGGSESNAFLLITAVGASAFVGQIVSELCRENGEIMLKNAVEFACNAEIMLLSLPLLKELFEKVTMLLKI